MRETRTSGSGRGDQGNPVPYRHRVSPVARVPAKVSFPIRTGRSAGVAGTGLHAPKPTSPQQELRSDYSLLRQIRAAQPKHSHQAEFWPTLNSTISCRTGAHLSFRGGGAEGPRPSQNGLAPVENCPDPPPITTG